MSSTRSNISVRRPPALGPPKFREGQWLFWCHKNDARLEVGINIIKISRVENRIWTYDYFYYEKDVVGNDREERYLFTDDKNMFATFEEALDRCRQVMEEQRLSLLVKEGIVL